MFNIIDITLQATTANILAGTLNFPVPDASPSAPMAAVTALLEFEPFPFELISQRLSSFVTDLYMAIWKP